MFERATWQPYTFTIPLILCWTCIYQLDLFLFHTLLIILCSVAPPPPSMSHHDGSFLQPSNGTERSLAAGGLDPSSVDVSRSQDACHFGPTGPPPPPPPPMHALRMHHHSGMPLHVPNGSSAGQNPFAQQQLDKPWACL